MKEFDEVHREGFPNIKDAPGKPALMGENGLYFLAVSIHGIQLYTDGGECGPEENWVLPMSYASAKIIATNLETADAINPDILRELGFTRI